MGTAGVWVSYLINSRLEPWSKNMADQFQEENIHPGLDIGFLSFIEIF